MIDRGSRRIGRASAASLSASEIQGLVRRFGWMFHRVLEHVIGRVISQRDQGLAEELQDALKPVADFLVHFDIKEVRMAVLSGKEMEWHSDDEVSEDVGSDDQSNP